MQLYEAGKSMRTLLAGVMLAALLAPAAWARETTYVVRRNDTLYGIAEEHGISVTRLAERNGLSKNYHVLAGQRLIIPGTGSDDDSAPAAGGSSLTVTVRRNDTLYGLADKYGVSVDALAARNGFSKNYQLKVGERLVIPGAQSASGSVASDDGLPDSIRRAIQNADVRAGRWKYIVIHHSGVDEGTVKGMDRYHREVRHMENGLAYHFVIGNGHGMGDGEIAVGHRWREQLDGGHLRSEAQNKIAIGICLVGNFDKHAPSARQLRSLHALVEALMHRCDLTYRAVKTHQQINIIGTRCPGRHFPAQSFVAGLK
jgi:LysM repeat protein